MGHKKNAWGILIDDESVLPHLSTCVCACLQARPGRSGAGRIIFPCVGFVMESFDPLWRSAEQHD